MSRFAWQNHVCGLYYISSSHGRYPEKVYLPQVELEAHATILTTSSRTSLTQTFSNPSSTKGIKELRYIFPLYDGVSVVGFTCQVADRTINGEVKEKEKAREDFKQAVSRGETAGLFEQLGSPDVFSTTVGNVPPDAKVIINITYQGELKHDMEVDGIRFMIPSIIAPRYGKYPAEYDAATAQTASASKIAITVDAEMSEGSFIQKVLSPTHPISVTMGAVSLQPNAEPTMTKASATLSLGTAQLQTDFVLQVVAKDAGVPRAFLETHPTIPNQRALMATLVPKFNLPAEKPEIVFVCDRSGSMSGSNITLVRQALQVFLKSLPVGVVFNICSFGSSFSFLWPKSVPYSQSTLDEAVRHVDTFAADYGGTEMLQPVIATVEQRYQDVPLELMLLTDGDIWGQNELFTYLNGRIQEEKAPIRVFTLGVGSGVSHSLVEGVARAGNGFSQTVGDGEKMDAKVVRMLRGALSPHVTDYRLEINFGKHQAGHAGSEEDFEIVEKVADSLALKLDLGTEAPVPQKPISLFDPSADPDAKDASVIDHTGESRYDYLPKIDIPKIIQAPQNITSLFAFNRTTVYLLLGPNAPQQTPKSVVLRGTSKHGPLELEIPVQILDRPGQMIHQMAAKKASFELEQGRGWLSECKDASGTLLKEQIESRFSSMVEREAVRLGVQFQVSGKWTSFVAVEKRTDDRAQSQKRQKLEEWEFLDDKTIDGEKTTKAKASAPSSISFQDEIEEEECDEDDDCGFGLFDSPSTLPPPPPGAPPSGMPAVATRGLFQSQMQASPTQAQQQMQIQQLRAHQVQAQQQAGQQSQQHMPLIATSGFPPAWDATTSGMKSVGAPFGSAGSPATSSGLFGSSTPNSGPPGTVYPQSVFGSTFGGGSVGAASPAMSAAPQYASGALRSTSPSVLHRKSTGGKAARKQSFAPNTASAVPPPASAPAPDSPPIDPLTAIIALQTFSGAWPFIPALFRILHPISSTAVRDAFAAGHPIPVLSLDVAAREAKRDMLAATAVVVAFLEERFAEERGSWELLVEKARGWLGQEVGGAEQVVEELVTRGREVVLAGR